MLFETVEILFITIIHAHCCLSCLGEKGTTPVQKEMGLHGMYVSYVYTCALYRINTVSQVVAVTICHSRINYFALIRGSDTSDVDFLMGWLVCL